MCTRRAYSFNRVATPIAKGSDGRPRCWWGASSEEYERYHDEEWGRPVTDDRGLYERMVLEGFQSGLSWLTILRKRPAFRAAFVDFDPVQVAGFDDHDVRRLMADTGIVRNLAKVNAAITNARATVSLRDQGGLAALIESHRPDQHPAPTSTGDVQTATAESLALSKALKKAGFVFVGPTTMYALMEAIGIVDDHLTGCHRHGAASR
jgi:DNA-3-methyladenine glycosylase I